jgi:hypothetical protein
MMAEFSAPKMGGVFLNDGELDALQRLMWGGYPYAYVLYVQELRRYMDRATGVVGERRRVSEKGMRETLERVAGPGPNGSARCRSRDFVQRQISALERFGLVERLPKVSRRSPMVFLLPLAVEGSIRLGETRTKIHTITRTKDSGKNPVVVSIYGDSMNESAQRPAQRPAQHQEKITTTTGPESFTLAELAAVDMGMVVDAYHEALPGLPSLRVPTEGHRLMVARVWYMATEPPGKHQTPRFWQGYFAQCAKSDFLMGRVTLDQRRGAFKANFKALVDVGTVLKVINGEYT